MLVMKKMLGKYIESDSEKGGGEPRFIGTRLAVSDVLDYVKLGHSFEWIADNFDNRITKEAVAEAVTLAAKAFEHDYSGRKHRQRPTRKTASV
jgi:uncharacterized protein (DUF433 family)